MTWTRKHILIVQISVLKSPDADDDDTHSDDAAHDVHDKDADAYLHDGEHDDGKDYDDDHMDHVNDATMWIGLS
jgi:hypothetical protein